MKLLVFVLGIFAFANADYMTFQNGTIDVDTTAFLVTPETTLEANVWFQVVTANFYLFTGGHPIQKFFDGDIIETMVGGQLAERYTYPRRLICKATAVEIGDDADLLNDIMHVRLFPSLAGNVKDGWVLTVEADITRFGYQDVEQDFVIIVTLKFEGDHKFISKSVDKKKREECELGKRDSKDDVVVDRSRDEPQATRFPRHHHKKTFGRCLRRFFRHLSVPARILFACGAFLLIILLVTVTVLCCRRRERSTTVEVPRLAFTVEEEKKAPIPEDSTTFHMQMENEVGVSDKMKLVA